MLSMLFFFLVQNPAVAKIDRFTYINLILDYDEAEPIDG